MVLEEVSSDPDPYSSPSYDDTTSPPPQTDLSRIPQPVPFASAWGFTLEKLQKGITSEQSNAQTVLKRRLEPPEADAIAFHFAKGYRYASYGAPLGMAAGLWRASATTRWPLVPRQWSDRVMLNVADMKLTRLKPAIQGLRGLMYVSFGYMIGSMLFTSYGATVAAVGSIMDPRLKSMSDVVNRKVREKNAELSRPRPPLRADPMGQGERTAGELWRNHRGAIKDDASPTTAGTDDFFSDERAGNGAMMNDGQIQKQQQRRQQPSPRQNRASTRTERLSDDYSSTSDDQSPSESAWDRIRRENSSPSPSRARNQQGFSFSSSDSDKDEAQKHFDERVEQERRGEDSGGRRRKW